MPDMTPAKARRALDDLVDDHGGDEVFAVAVGRTDPARSKLSVDEAARLEDITATLDASEIGRRTEQDDADTDDITTDFGALEPEVVDDSDDDTTGGRQQTFDPADSGGETEFPTEPDQATRDAMQDDDTRQQGLGGAPTREESAQATEEARRRQEQREQRAQSDRERSQRTISEVGDVDSPDLTAFDDGGDGGSGSSNGGRPTGGVPAPSGNIPDDAVRETGTDKFAGDVLVVDDDGRNVYSLDTATPQRIDADVLRRIREDTTRLMGPASAHEVGTVMGFVQFEGGSPDDLYPASFQPNTSVERRTGGDTGNR